MNAVLDPTLSFASAPLFYSNGYGTILSWRPAALPYTILIEEEQVAITSCLSIDEQLKTILFGSEFGDDRTHAIMTLELRERLIGAQKEERPLRVYAGYDPSRPDLHLGHSITLRKLRQFQDLGHEVIFLVGTFTAQVGDTSDKLKGRPRITEKEVIAAGSTYAEQAFKILDREKTTVLYNHEWLKTMTLADVIEIASQFTVQQFIVRDNYRKRIESNIPVGLHEFMYALLQGYDAVHLKADVQIGATEQLFNILAGRKLQEWFGQRPCVCITFPILVGTDGKMRMSKSSDNYVGLTEPPEQQYGKVMSISDGTMQQWIKYVTRWPVVEIDEYLRSLAAGTIRPMELKKKLAWEIVSAYHSVEEADRAQRHFERLHQERMQPEASPTITFPHPVSVIDVLVRVEGVKSRSEARRLIRDGAVEVDGVVVQHPDQVLVKSTLVRVGKRRYVQVAFKEP